MKGVILFFAVCVAVTMACESDKDCNHHGMCLDGQQGFCDQSTKHCHCKDIGIGRRAHETCTDDDLSACTCEHGGTPICKNDACHCEHHAHP